MKIYLFPKDTNKVNEMEKKKKKLKKFCAYSSNISLADTE